MKISDFCGIDLRDTHKNALGTSKLVNLRTLSDGSLARRDGTRLLATATNDIRAVWTGVAWGQYRCIAVAGNTICEMNFNTGMLLPRAVISSSSGEAEFFYYRDVLYLVDGTKLYGFRNNRVVTPFGYVPLVAKNWRDNEVGEIYQPRNLLNDHARFDYIISANASPLLLLDDFASAVDAVYINGSSVSVDRCTVGTYTPYIYVSGLQEGDRVSLYITYRDAVTGLDELKTATRAEIFGGISNSRPFLFGCSNKSVLFSSKYVSESDVNAAKTVYAQADALYFPVGYEFSIADGQYGISTVCRHLDRLLIFTEGGVWRADSNACGIEDFPVMNVNLGVAVKSSRGAALLGNSPCAVGVDGIYRFTTNTDELDDCNAYTISDGIAPILSRAFLESSEIYADTKNSEFLLCAPNVTNTIFVYSDITHKWTSFEGLFAQKFFDFEGSTAFVNGKLLYVFDAAAEDDSGVPFDVLFEGNVADFGTDKKKHISSIELCFDGAEATCGLHLDGSTEENASVIFKTESEHSRVSSRVSAERFYYLAPTIRGTEECKKIHSLTIKTR